MPNWKKLIVSGSDATLNNITLGGTLAIPGFSNVSSSLASLSSTTVSGGDLVYQTGSGTDSIRPKSGSNTACAAGSVIGGGASNDISSFGACSGILGGQNNQITASLFGNSALNGNCHSIIAGGHNNTINVCRESGEASTGRQGCHVIVGGECNEIFAHSVAGGNSFIGGGCQNKITGSQNIRFNSIVGGYNNFVGGVSGTQQNTRYSNIVGGQSNYIENSSYSNIVGGFQNKMFPFSSGQYGCMNSIVGGCNNQITGSSIASFIGGGEDNIIRRCSSGINQHNSILGGKSNEINNGSCCSNIIGHSNIINNSECSTLIGSENSVDSGADGVIGIGHGMTLGAAQANTVVISNLCIFGTNGSDGTLTGIHELTSDKGTFGTGTTVIDDDITSTGNIELTGSIHAKTDITASGKFVGTELKTPIGANDLILDADGADIILKDGGASFGRFKRDNSNFVIKSEGRDKSIIFKGNDDGTAITALTLDMENAGAAKFESNITASGNISSSGTITMLTASIGGGIFTSASLAAGGFTPSLSTDLPAQNITASANISASGTIIANAFTGTLTGTSTGLSGAPNITVTNLTVEGTSALNDNVSVDGDISADGNISSDGATFSGTLSIPGFSNVSASLAAAPGTGEFKAVSQSVFLGENAGENQIAGINPVTGDTIDSENVGIGYQALKNTTIGTNNIAIGSNVLSGSVNGFNNIAISKGALGGFTGNNTAIGIGFDSGKPHDDNVFTGGHTGSTIIGHQALNDFNIKSTAEISNNTAVGLRALRGLGGTGTSNVNNVKNNTAIGRQAGLNIVHTTGGALNHNTFLGNSAGMNAVPQQGNMLSNLLLGARAGMSGYIGSNNIVLQNATGDTALGNTNWGVSENISIGGNGALYSDNNIIISNASSSVLNTVGTSSISTETLSTNQSGNVIIGGHSNNISNIGSRTAKDNSIINSTTMTIGQQGSGGSDDNFVASAKGINVQGDRNILLGVELTTSDPTQILSGDKNTIINSTGFQLSNSTDENTIIGSTGIEIGNTNGVGKNVALHSQDINFNTGDENISIKSVGTSYTGSDKTVALIDSNSSISGDNSVFINTSNITDKGDDNTFIGTSNHTTTAGINGNTFIGGTNMALVGEGDYNIFLNARDGEMSGSNNIVSGLNHAVGSDLRHSFIHGNGHDVKPSGTSQRNFIVGFQHVYTAVGNNSFIGGTKGSIGANNSFGFGKGLKLSSDNMGAFGKFNDDTANGSANSLFTVGCGPSATIQRNAMNIVSATVSGAGNKAIVYLDQLVDFNFANDSAAADAGIGVGGLYHTEGTVKIRLE